MSDVQPNADADAVRDGLQVPYGEPDGPDDVRFSVHSAAGWGTNAYGQNPDEFLGEPTEDDNDWIRGSSRFLD
jgi:hypothetical protein